MLLPQQEQARRAPFGYICRACSRCCPHKLIQVNPYEIARLARFFGLSTGDFRIAYTERDGTLLKRNEDDACIFLGEWGCGVHPERPLVCRLFPLGRRVAADGTETWVRTSPHPESEGEFTGDGTIADYIAAQGALPFMQAADDYADWVRKAYAAADEAGTEPVDVRSAGELLDLDSTIAAYCGKRGFSEPENIEARRDLHLQILNAYLEGGTP